MSYGSLKSQVKMLKVDVLVVSLMVVVQSVRFAQTWGKFGDESFHEVQQEVKPL